MYLKSHGGHCCGISTIHGFVGDPTTKCPSIPPRTPENAASYPGRIIWEEIPSETALLRLRRYIDKVRSIRSSGVIEAILNCSQYSVKGWHDVMIDEGFKVVNEFVNSNSMNTVRIYNLNTGEIPPKKREPKPEPKPKKAKKKTTQIIDTVEVRFV